MSAVKYDIDTLLDEVITLPSMPEPLTRILKLLDDPASPMAAVAKAIAGDPAITLKTLRLVNSAYYGLGQEVKTVDHAVVLLGMKVIKNLVLTATVFQAIEGAADRFIRHSVACGVAMRVLAREPAMAGVFESPEEAFIFGLLHDIGKVILSEFLPKECAEVAVLVKDKGYAWHEAEWDIIGSDHAEVGGRLAERWKLSPAVVSAILAHHDMDRAPEEFRQTAALLATANYFAGAAGFASYPKPSLLMNDRIWTATGFPSAGIPGAVDRFVKALPDIEELIRLAS